MFVVFFSGLFAVRSTPASILGHRIPDVPVPLFSVYPASKFALSALVQTVRQELQFHRANVKVTVSDALHDCLWFLFVYSDALLVRCV